MMTSGTGLSKSERRRLQRHQQQERPAERRPRQSKKNRLFMYAFIGAVAIGVAAMVVHQNSGTGQLITGASSPPAADYAGDDPFIGDPAAPVTIVEFGDYQCPFCRRFFSDVEPQIIQAYVETGRARLVFRDFPLRAVHPEAQRAAEAAHCAGEQGAYWAFHDLAYQQQERLGPAGYREWAAELGLDRERFTACIDAGAYRQEVEDDLQDGQRAGVTGTPTFFVNGQKIVGGQPFGTFSTLIESFLNEQAN